MILKEKLFLEKARLAKKQNAQYAAEVLAAQMPRLELYSTMSVSSFACKHCLSSCRPPVSFTSR